MGRLWGQEVAKPIMQLSFIDECHCGIFRSFCHSICSPPSVRIEWFGVMFVRVGGFEDGGFWRWGWGIEMFMDIDNLRK